MMVHFRKDFFSKSKDECRVDKPMETKITALTLIHLSPAFLILGVGFLLSTFCLVIEIMSKYVLIWAPRRTNMDDTEQSLQPACESRPGTGHAESGTITEYTSMDNEQSLQPACESRPGTGCVESDSTIATACTSMDTEQSFQSACESSDEEVTHEEYLLN